MLGEPRPGDLGSIREAEGIPQDATTASVSLDGVMVPLRPGEDGRAKASWREAACGTVSFHDAEGKRLTLYLGRMPESGKLTLKAQLASEVAHIRRARPEIGIVAIAEQLACLRQTLGGRYGKPPTHSYQRLQQLLHHVLGPDPLQCRSLSRRDADRHARALRLPRSRDAGQSSCSA